ncbi:7126_t:CDS:2, partial [Funneliformis caledonium]
FRDALADTANKKEDARLSGHELLETDRIDEKTGQPKYKREKEA